MDVVFEQGRQAYVGSVLQRIGQGGYGWLIVPTRADKAWWVRALADQAPATSFGVRVETIDDWTADRWTLFGDGRAIIDAMRRLLAMKRAVGRINEMVGPSARLAGRRASSVLCQAMSLGSGVRSFERRLAQDAADGGDAFGSWDIPDEADGPDGPDSAAARIATAWEAMRSYRADIAERHYIEAGQALAALIANKQQVLGYGKPALAVGFVDAPPIHRRFLAECCHELVLEVGRSPAFDAARGFARLLAGSPGAACPDGQPGVGAGAQQTCPDEGEDDAPDAGVSPACAQARELVRLCEHLYRPGEPVAPTGAVRFALASGRYAVPVAIDAQVARIIEEGANPADVFVVSADPSATYRAVAPRLARRGIASQGPVGMQLAHTTLGQALEDLLVIVAMCDEDFGVRPGMHIVDVLCALALSPCSGVSTHTAYRLGALWRGSPHMQTPDAHLHIADFMELCADPELEQAAFDIMKLVELARAGRIVEAAELMVARAWPSLGPDERLLQKRAIGRVHDLAAACEEFGARIDDFDELIVALSVQAPTRVAVEGAAGAGVSFISLDEAALTPMPFALFCDLTAESFPITRDDTAAVRLIAADDLDASNRMLPTMRHTFYRAVRNVGLGAVFERELTTFDAQAVRPSVLFEEVCDCYNPNVADPSSLDKATGLPMAVVEKAGLVGRYDEGNLMSLLPRAAYAQDDAGNPVGTLFEPIAAGVFEKHGAAQLMQQPRHGKVVFSPSGVEAYAMCPYGWFVSRRVNPQGLDADPLSPQARGLLAHLVLQRFYELWRAQGHRGRLAEDDLAAARPVFEEAFAQALAQRQQASENPLLPVTKMDHEELRRMKADYWRVICDDVDYLPAGFAPHEFELGFGFEGRGCRYPEVEYAGRVFRGSIDRIDIAADGRLAVVTDYKGSADKDEHTPLVTASPHGGDAQLVLPPRIQVFIYAGIAQRLLRTQLDPELKVVGAFYRPYRFGKPTCGAYAPVLASPDGAPPSYATAAAGLEDGGPQGFQGLLQRTEQLVAVALDAMERGYFEAAPRTEHACEFCPVNATCASRIESKDEVSARWI